MANLREDQDGEQIEGQRVGRVLGKFDENEVDSKIHANKLENHKQRILLPRPHLPRLEDTIKKSIKVRTSRSH